MNASMANHNNQNNSMLDESRMSYQLKATIDTKKRPTIMDSSLRQSVISPNMLRKYDGSHKIEKKVSANASDLIMLKTQEQVAA